MLVRFLTVSVTSLLVLVVVVSLSVCENVRIGQLLTLSTINTFLLLLLGIDARCSKSNHQNQFLTDCLPFLLTESVNVFRLRS